MGNKLSLTCIILVASLYACSSSDSNSRASDPKEDVNFSIDDATKVSPKAIYEKDLYPLLLDNCGGCHASTSPTFGVSDAGESFETVQDAKLIDYVVAGNSRLISQMEKDHQNCGPSIECTALLEKVRPIIDKMIEAQKTSEEPSSQPDFSANITETLKLSKAVERVHVVPPPGYVVLEAEKFANLDMKRNVESSPTSYIEYVTPKTEPEEEGEPLNPKINLLDAPEVATKSYLWMLYKSDANGSFDVEINGEPFVAGDPAAVLPFNYDVSGDWKWSLYNSNESLINLDVATNILLTPTAQTPVMIDKFILLPYELPEGETPKLTRKLLTFDLSKLTGVPAILDIVAEDDGKGYYQVGQPVVTTSVELYLKKDKDFL